MADRSPQKKIESFSLQPGRVLAGKYEVVDLLGAGWRAKSIYSAKQ